MSVLVTPVTSVSTLLMKFLTDDVKQYYDLNKNHKYDGGVNIYVSEDVILEPNKTKLVPTGISTCVKNITTNIDFDTIDTMYYFMAPRSSIYKTPLIMHNSMGIIDAGYRGEIKIPLHNLSGDSYKIEKGVSLAQLLHPRGAKWEVEFTDTLPDFDERGDRGFGSTNKPQGM
tara:strand:- start:481 stop:996 length:516 start_codon:yes stop_codon:yes gene_type:complete